VFVSSQLGDGFARTQQEILEERAAALRRISETLEEILEALHRLEREAEAAPPAAERAKAHQRLRRRAKLYRWYLVVQREANGLRNHGILDEVYPLPGPLSQNGEGGP
jgi:hypothetical protein